jgi:hypothetical protein
MKRKKVTCQVDQSDVRGEQTATAMRAMTEDDSHSDPSLSNQELELGNVSIHAAVPCSAASNNLFRFRLTSITLIDEPSRPAQVSEVCAVNYNRVSRDIMTKL